MYGYNPTKTYLFHTFLDLKFGWLAE